MLEELSIKLSNLHAELYSSRLVAWTGGNISAKDEDSQLVAIKPSGVKYSELSPESIVIVDLEGKVVYGNNKPSTDTSSHLYIYKNNPEVGGVTHTHSTFATAFCGAGQSIPCILTAQADEFGGIIPCAGYAEIGNESIGENVIEMLEKYNSRTVLLKNHGVFSVGKNAEQALKNAVMAEDCAKTTFYAIQLGSCDQLTDAQIKDNWDRYQNTYGQK